jgi:hypothetical protein
MGADYARSLVGLGATLGPLALLDPAAPVAWILTAVAVLFLVYFARTVCRHLTHIELDETGISARGPLAAGIRWAQLRSVHVDYFSTRSDREEGWMQLKLRGPRRAIRVDSDIEGFAELARAARAHALARGLELDSATRANLDALEKR